MRNMLRATRETCAVWLALVVSCGGRSALGIDSDAGDVNATANAKGSGGSAGSSARVWTQVPTQFPPPTAGCNNCWVAPQPSFERVWAVRADEVWVVGRQANYKAPSTVVLMCWNALRAEWRDAPSPAGPAYGQLRLDGSSESNAVALTSPPDEDESPLHRWDEAKWNALTAPGASNAKTISVNSSKNIWVCCGEDANRPARDAAHWNGTSWRQMPLPQEFQAVEPNALLALPGRELWLASNGGLLLHFDGESWHSVPTTLKGDILALHFDGRLVWVVSGEHVLRFEGARPVPLPTPPTEGHGLSSIWGYDEHVWVVGAAGTVLHFDGTHWERETAPSEISLNSVYGIPGQFVWAVGNGTLLQRRL